MDRKGQSSGLVSGLVFGIAGLIMAVIIALIIVSNVQTIDDNLGSTVTVTVTNDTSSGITAVNGTTYTLTIASSTSGFGGFVVHELWNGTTLIGSGNYTVGSSGTIVGTAGRTANYTGVTKLSYDYTWTPTENAGDNMITNLTSGIQNVSNKVPTVLLIAAIVLILSILAILVGVWQKMRMGSTI